MKTLHFDPNVPFAEPKTGLVYDLPDPAYRAIPRISMSGAKPYAKTEAHGISQAKTGLRNVKPETLMLGRAVHTAILEPHRLELDYVVSPKFDRRTTLGKEAHAEFEAGVGDRSIVSQDQLDLALQMRESAMAHPLAAAMLSEGDAEVAQFWQTELDDGTIVPCKGRLDWLRMDWKGHPLILDVKSCQDASPRGFARACANFSYHLQDYMYSSGLVAAAGVEHPTFVFLAIEKEPPYACAVYELDALARSRGCDLMEICLQRYVSATAAVAAGRPPQSYPQSLVQLSLPTWA